MFDPIADLNAIDGIISDLASRTGRPQGYPFSKVTVYAVPYAEIRPFIPRLETDYVEVRPAKNLPCMKKLDFKKAGPLLKNRVQDAKNDLAEGIDVCEKYSLPSDCLKIAERFDPVDEPLRKTTGCRKYLIECESADMDDLWLVIKFRKQIKKYVTEDLALNIVPPVFGSESREPTVPKVRITVKSVSERLYQALIKYGEKEFAKYPIRLKIPSRKELWGFVADPEDPFVYCGTGYKEYFSVSY